MKAIFKDNAKLIINSADSTERLLVEAFIENANSGKKELNVEKLVDINGEIAGMSLELIEKVEAPVEEQPSEEPTEPEQPIEDDSTEPEEPSGEPEEDAE